MQPINNKPEKLLTKAPKNIFFVYKNKIKRTYKEIHEDFIYWQSFGNTTDLVDIRPLNSTWKNFITWQLYMRQHTRFMKKIIATQKVPGKYYDVTVTSYGGSGSTLLLKFLDENRFISNNSKNFDCIKHIGFPPRRLASRYIYIFANPIESLLSLYRRYKGRLIRQHSFTLNLDLQPKFVIPPAKTLEKYIEKGKDRFLFERHFNNWFNACLPCPVLFIRYEKLWDNLEVLFDFLGLHNIDARNSFPKYHPRKSTVDNTPADILDELERMYGKFAERLNTLPDYILCKPHSSAKTTISADTSSATQNPPELIHESD